MLNGIDGPDIAALPFLIASTEGQFGTADILISNGGISTNLRRLVTFGTKHLAPKEYGGILL